MTWPVPLCFCQKLHFSRGQLKEYPTAVHPLAKDISGNNCSAKSVCVKILLLGITWFACNSLAFCSQSQEHESVGHAPIVMQAERGIEWHRNGERFITAHGNVRFTHNHIRIGTETLTAFYHNKTITAALYRLQADGNIRLTSPMGTASGETADYDVHNKILCLIGHPVHLETATETLTARKVIEYRREQQVVVARGDVHLVTQEGCVLRADMVTADFRQSTRWTQRITLLEVAGRVRIETSAAISRGEHGVYNMTTGLATIIGSVQMTSGHDQLKGASGSEQLLQQQKRQSGCGTDNRSDKC